MWGMILPPWTQDGECRVLWNDEADASEWSALGESRWESNEECEDVRRQLAVRARNGLQGHLAYLRAREDAVPWWERVIRWPLEWFWVGSDAAKREKCAAIWDSEVWEHARCVAG
jgi:hypothetical protein